MKQLDVRETRTFLGEVSMMLVVFPGVILRHWQ